MLAFSYVKNILQNFFLFILDKSPKKLLGYFPLKNINDSLRTKQYIDIMQTATDYRLFQNFSLLPTLRTAPSSMVLGRVFAKWRAVLFCTKSYYPLVGAHLRSASVRAKPMSTGHRAPPIPLNSLTGWLRNSYESLFSSVGYFFRNEKRGEPISLKPIRFPIRIIE